AKSTEFPGCVTQDATISGVLLASHRLRISASFLWSALHSSVIDRLSTSQAADASATNASRISIFDRALLPPARQAGSAGVASHQYAKNRDRCRCIDPHRPQHHGELAFEGGSRPSIEASLFS